MNFLIYFTLAPKFLNIIVVINDKMYCSLSSRFLCGPFKHFPPLFFYFSQYLGDLEGFFTRIRGFQILK